jgi:phage shock protein PspC (stress-responsive transcriptional regulator)
MSLMRRLYRPDDALLAGLCAELARRLGWNVWALRVLFLVALLVKTLPTALLYLAASLVMGLVLADRARPAPPGGLASDRLSERGQRIEELEERFRKLERETR